RIRAHHADALALLHGAIDDADKHDDAEIDVVPAVDQQRLQRRVAVAIRRRQAGDDCLQHALYALTRLGRDQDRIRGIDADHVLDLLLYLLRFCRPQIDPAHDPYELGII